MPELTTTVDVKNVPDVQKALRAAADAFAESLGVGPTPANDWTINLRSTTTEARAALAIADAWNLLVDVADTAYVGQARVDRNDRVEELKGHIDALHAALDDFVRLRREWVEEIESRRTRATNRATA